MDCSGASETTRCAQEDLFVVGAVDFTVRKKKRKKK
jgi:hypothetical protein